MKKLFILFLGGLLFVSGCDVGDAFVDSVASLQDVSMFGNKQEMSLQPFDIKEVTEYEQTSVYANEFSMLSNLINSVGSVFTTLKDIFTDITIAYSDIREGFFTTSEAALLVPGQLMFPYRTNFAVTSLFGWRCLNTQNYNNYETMTPKFHTGIDLTAGYGTDILASATGTVVSQTYSVGGYGYYVVVAYPVSTIAAVEAGTGSVFTADSTLFLLYAHMLEEGRPDVGTVVSDSTVLGREGNSGNTTGTASNPTSGAHLHLMGYLDTSSPNAVYSASMMFASSNPSSNSNEAKAKSYSPPGYVVDPLSRIFDTPSRYHLEALTNQIVTANYSNMTSVSKATIGGLEGWVTDFYAQNVEYSVTPETMEELDQLYLTQ